MLVAFWIVGGITAAVAAVIIGFVAFGGGGGSSTGFTAVPADYPHPVQAIPRIESRRHFPVGEVRNDYNSNPPTSGEHTVLADFGIHDVPVVKESVIHNMEHGGVAVWYNCNASPPLAAEQCTELRNSLGQVVSSEIGAGQQVLMTPYENMEDRIALTAWGFLDAFDEFDAERVRKFIETFECNYNPEGFC